MSLEKENQETIISTNETFTARKKHLLQLAKNDELRDARLNENYAEEVLKHDWLIDSYIAKYGFVTEDAPENTLKAYQNAIDRNYPILLNVQMIDDGEIVCFYPRTVCKSTGESGYISKMSLAEIKEITLEETEETIPTLDEALEFIAGKVPVIIDIFNDSNVGKIEQKVVDSIEKYIEKYELFDSVAVMSLNPYTLEWFLNNATWLPRILRSGKFKIKMFGSIKTKKLTKLKLYKIALPDYVCYNAKDLPCKYIRKVKPVGVLAFNVKTQNEYMEVAKYCDNIIFDGFEPTI